jgi:phosphatidylserine decarboxylase
MTIHKEGYFTIIITMLIAMIVYYLGYHFLGDYPWIKVSVFVITLFFLVIILQFFRHPRRNIPYNEKHVLAPADGKVVVIEETEEGEVLKEKRIQVSIFMSPINVHVNRYPISGTVTYSKYHPGLYLVAWHPKSSLENERTTVVVETGNKTSILIRQIAGALARRIVCYSKEGDKAGQGEEMGFIKFGSRVDVFLPLTAKVNVNLNQNVTGGVTVLAELL